MFSYCVLGSVSLRVACVEEVQLRAKVGESSSPCMPSSATRNSTCVFGRCDASTTSNVRNTCPLSRVRRCSNSRVFTVLDHVKPSAGIT